MWRYAGSRWDTGKPPDGWQAPTLITIVWFAIDRRFQNDQTCGGGALAPDFYASVERRALQGPVQIRRRSSICSATTRMAMACASGYAKASRTLHPRSADLSFGACSVSQHSAERAREVEDLDLLATLNWHTDAPGAGARK